LLEEGVAKGAGRSGARFPATCHAPAITATAEIATTAKASLLIDLILPFQR